MTRLLTTLAAVVLLSFATAQDMPLIELFAMAAANDMDGTMTECPVDLETPQACFVHELGVDWARMDWESLVREYGDLDWVVPWQDSRDTDMVSRIIEKTSDPTMYVAVLLAPWGDYKALVVVAQMELP